MKNTTANRLQYATSPYLLQHAHNPVDWYEWGNEALDKARREDKPILVSIGYSACHWCHVMERESFEDEDIAKIMNEHYVCIKVDREERPDIDQIYMDAVQALGVNGGWPLNVVLTPDQKPFFGGTYFGPQAWTQVLSNIQQAYTDNRTQVDSTADQLGLHLLRSDVARFRQEGNDSALTADMEEIFQHLSARFDRNWGGMERAPKFIMPSVWQWLLRYYTLAKNETALQQVFLTLNKAGMGGIYDPVGGGFARYSVDGEWFAPHFEKMLYDNAQLLSLYSEAYAVSGEQDFKTIVYETFDWLQREMTHANGGFYSALDADSEGEEGKFYVWTARELKTLLGADYNLIAGFYSITDEGNWEHGNNILFRHAPVDAFLRKHSLTHADWTIQLEDIKKILLKARANRVRPGLDDKIIAAWNAMTVSGLTDAYRIFGDQRFLSAAIRNMRFIENELMIGGKIFRSYKGHRSTIAGFLDDYAYVIQGCLKLYQVTFDEYWIHRAAFLLTYTLDEFFDPAEGYFFYTAHSAEGLIARKKEIFDNVIPSSNALMAQNLFQLGVLFDREDWKEKAVAMTNGFAQLIKGEPNYMSYWAMVYTEIRNGLSEVVVMGDASHTLRTELQKNFYPFALFMGAQKSGTLPLLVDKTAEGDVSTIYVCHNKTCRLPVHSVHEALPLIV